METARGTTRMLIVYYSRFGSVRALAEAIAEGAQREPNVQMHFLVVEDESIEEVRPGEDAHAMTVRRAQVIGQLAAADAIIVGSPAYFGSMASPVKRLFEDCATASGQPMPDRTRPWRHRL